MMFKKILSLLTAFLFLSFVTTDAVALGIPIGMFSSAAPVGSYINSIQQVSITIGAAAASNTATISTVGANAFVIIQGWTTTSANPLAAQSLPRIELTNSTTVTAYRNTLGTPAIIVKAVVVDPAAGLVSSVQQGTVSISGAATGTATITSVNTSNSAVFYLGNTTTDISSGGQDMMDIKLTNSTTVTATLRTGTTTATVGFVVVVFNTAAIQSIQTSERLYSANSTNVTISSVTTANTMLAWGGFTSSSGGGNDAYMSLTGATTVNVNSVNDTDFRIGFTVIEFKSGVLARAVQRGQITLTNLTSQTATITSASTAKTILNFCGSQQGEGTASLGDEMLAVAQTNATTVTGTAGTTSSFSSVRKVGYEAVTFN